MSIVAEELGFVGVVLVLCLVLVIVVKSLKLGNKALQQELFNIFMVSYRISGSVFKRQSMLEQVPGCCYQRVDFTSREFRRFQSHCHAGSGWHIAAH